MCIIIPSTFQVYFTVYFCTLLAVYFLLYYIEIELEIDNHVVIVISHPLHRPTVTGFVRWHTVQAWSTPFPAATIQTPPSSSLAPTAVRKALCSV